MQFHLRFTALAALSLILAGNAGAAERLEQKYKVVADITYKQGGSEYESERCKLDLYLPVRGKSFPVVLWFHGGGLEGGDKGVNSAVQIGQRFATAGIAVVSVNYRLSPRVKYPAYLEDAAAAFAWVHQNIAKYGGSPEQLFVSGHSAGGYLTAMLAVDERYLKQHGLTTKNILGAIPVSGQMDSHSTVRKERGIVSSEPVIDESAPLHYVGKDAPPILSLCGSMDLPGRTEINQRFVEAMQSAGHTDTTLEVIAGRNHSSIVGSLQAADDEVAKLMLKFIRKHAGTTLPAETP